MRQNFLEINYSVFSFGALYFDTYLLFILFFFRSSVIQGIDTFLFTIENVKKRKQSFHIDANKFLFSFEPDGPLNSRHNI